MTARAGKQVLTPEEAKNWRLAKLFDLRSFIGALLLIFGVLVIIPGIVATRRRSPSRPGSTCRCGSAG